MESKSKKSRDDLLETYFRQIKGFPLLSFEDELELSKQVQEGSTEDVRVQALHKLVNCNLRLVVRIAGLFNAPNIPFLDLIQEGNMGLIRAAEKYDHRKNVRFTTYANWWVQQFINRFISSKGRVVRLPRQKEETLRKIHNTYHTLCQTLMHQPRNTDIAEELGIPVQDVDTIINMTAEHLPYESFFSEDNMALGTMDMHGDYTYSPESNLFRQFSHDGTLHILNKLKKQEKRVLSYRYQLDGCKRCTLKEIGDELDLSPEAVRQIEIRALKKIHSHVNELKECVYVEAI